MSKGSLPGFFDFLDLLVGAFQLGFEEPSLVKNSTTRSHLSGHRPDIRAAELQKLLSSVAKALLASGIFPALPATLGSDTEVWVQNEDGDFVPSMQPLTMEQELTLRIANLHHVFSSLLAEPYSQLAASRLLPEYALQPLVRFAAHHLSVSIGWLWDAGLVNEDTLHFQSPQMTWCQEHPRTTPLQELANRLDLSPAKVLLELQRRNQAVHDTETWNRKTVANQWSGGPHHPRIATLQRTIELLDGPASTLLPSWRRWWGLRYLARATARLWGWEWVANLVGTTLRDAEHLQTVIQLSERPSDDPHIVSRMVWDGYGDPMMRRFFASITKAVDYQRHRTWHLDLVAIGKGTESTRLQACFQIATAMEPLREALLAKGVEPGAARQCALSLFWELQGPETPRHLEPAFAVTHAKMLEDWPAMHDAARRLVDRRPQYPDNHAHLVMALMMLRRHDEAIAAAHHGQVLHPHDAALQTTEVIVLLDRAEQTRRREHFLAALDLLVSLRRPDCDWDAQLLLTDCHLALGNWPAAIRSGRLVMEHQPHCSEAIALLAIAYRRLPDTRLANVYAERAKMRGAAALLEVLLKRDAEEGLLNRWHRYS